MTEKSTPINMPDMLVQAKIFLTGSLLWLVFEASSSLSTSITASIHYLLEWTIRVIIIAVALFICCYYLKKRHAKKTFALIIESKRFDLAITFSLGAIACHLFLSSNHHIKYLIENIESHWSYTILGTLIAIISSSITQNIRSSLAHSKNKSNFVSDREIDSKDDDLFEIHRSAEFFAKKVLEQIKNSNQVIGIDGPWGVGKTSFINIAQKYWQNYKDWVIIHRFEPLRYSADADLPDRLIREISSTIQSSVFAPELQPALSRYSRILKGKTDFSFLGFKFTLEPSNESIDDLLESIDQTLQETNKRIIVVIDDLDRLDTKSINAILYATKRTFNLSRITYILCFDTEMLLSNKDEDAKARDFLEKFISTKINLITNKKNLLKFLKEDWMNSVDPEASIPSSTMLLLANTLEKLHEIIQGKHYAAYSPIIGDLRKIKRFINAFTLMGVNNTPFSEGDFNSEDFINLMLLYMHYPGIFRKIFSEETDECFGLFSISRREEGSEQLSNSREFSDILQSTASPAKFILERLFSAENSDIATIDNIDELTLRSRACFNSKPHKNLERYLKFITHTEIPNPRETYSFYKNAIGEIINNTATVNSLLNRSDFSLNHGEEVHAEFWRILINHTKELNRQQISEAIDSLISYMNHYSFTSEGFVSSRENSVLNLLELLNRSGWERRHNGRRINSTNNTIEIAHRIFGEHDHIEEGIIDKLSRNDRGALGWYDLMLFRLYCSSDRARQLFSIYSALIIDQDRNAKTTGSVDELALLGMRKLSQRIFEKFKNNYISPMVNILSKIEETSPELIIGAHKASSKQDNQNSDFGDDVNSTAIAVAKNKAKIFITYQLTNANPPNSNGVGCGFYNEKGASDNKEISKQMNNYFFDICFNPNIDKKNVLYFLDHCLMHLSTPFETGSDQLTASPNTIAGGLDPKRLCAYWSLHKDTIVRIGFENMDRHIYTTNYNASYNDYLDVVIEVLDQLPSKIHSSIAD